MATGTLQTAARKHAYQMTHYLRKTINYNDASVSTGIKVGTVPAGAKILRCLVDVSTAFNAGTTNTYSIGTNSASYNNIASAAAAGSATLATTSITTTIANLASAADKDVYVLYTQTGTVASAGVLVVLLEYMPNNDS